MEDSLEDSYAAAVVALEDRVVVLEAALVSGLNQFQDHEQYDEDDAEAVAKMREALGLTSTKGRVETKKLSGNAYRIVDGVLESAAINADGSIDNNSWGEVTCIEDEDDLAKINKLMGTQYFMKDFAGR